jgi:hypothetical protein
VPCVEAGCAFCGSTMACVDAASSPATCGPDAVLHATACPGTSPPLGPAAGGLVLGCGVCGGTH